MRKRSGKHRSVPPRERVIGIWRLLFPQLWNPVADFLFMGVFLCTVCRVCVGVGGGAKLTSFQSSVDEISELSH